MTSGWPMGESWLTGRVAVITGAGSGIGAATARAVAAAGATAVLAGRRPEPLTRLVERIGRDGGRAAAVPCDGSRPQQVDELFGAAERLGPRPRSSARRASWPRRPWTS